MRIISGAGKGLKLSTLGGKNKSSLIRPTSDRSREALFNIIGTDKVVNAAVLDLFAGTGALGLESVSRGANCAFFVDKYSKALRLIEQNISICNFASPCIVLKRDLNKGLFFLAEIIRDFTDMLPNGSFDLIFLDPPYDQENWPFFLDELQKHPLIDAKSTIVCEDRSSNILPLKHGTLSLSDQRKYGDTGFWFYCPD